MDLVLFGIQGSGKGTQAKMLAKEFGYHIFEAGGELRSIAASGTVLGETVKSYIDEGHLVPHKIIMEVVQNAVSKIPQDQKILFDGIPRDEDQMTDFNEIMKQADRPFQCVNILLSEEDAFARIADRAQKEGRADDADEEKIRRRMGLFHEKTEPVIRWYQSKDLLREVDGSGSIDEVYDELRSVI